MNVIGLVLSCHIVKRSSDAVKRNGNVTFEVYHKVNFLCAQLLTTMVGCHVRIEVKLHEFLFPRDIGTLSSEVSTSPDPSEGFDVHTSTDEAVDISSVFQRCFALFAERI